MGIGLRRGPYPKPNPVRRAGGPDVTLSPYAASKYLSSQIRGLWPEAPGLPPPARGLPIWRIRLHPSEEKVEFRKNR